MDLASLNIQRGRDHGLPPYVRWREPCSLSPIKTFEDLDKVMLPSITRKFKSLYSSVEDIDLFSAGLAEKSMVGGLVGPTFACIIAQQFSNLRRGDRFWYENSNSESSFTAGQLQQIRQVTLAQVLCRTIDGIVTIQPFVFLTTDTLKNQRLFCDDPAIGHLNLELWAERSSKFKSNIDNSQKAKRTATDTSNPIFRSKEENINPRKGHNPEQTKVTTLKPFHNSVNQENKIIVKRPLGRPDNNNVTIVVQNNAVNAPVFVNEGIYDSHIKIQEQFPVRPNSNLNHPILNIPYRPQGKPIPTTIPHLPNYYLGRYPYVPHTFNDPYNPNPLVYGYRLPFSQDDIFYDNYSATSPRPTLYTYYKNLQQIPTTQIPKIDGYLINYGPVYHSLLAHPYERPKPTETFGHYELNDEQKPAQKPNYDGPKPSINMWLTKPNYASSDESYTHRPNYDAYKPLTTMRPNFRPNYASNDESYHMHRPSYDKYRPSTITRPNLQSNFGWNNEPYYGLDNNRPKPPSNSRPNEDLYHAQKPIYNGFMFLTNLRPDRPNQEPYGIQKPSDVGNLHLQNDNLINRPNGDYPTNPNKPQYPQEQWNNQKRPSEKPYDYDDPDAYQKKSNVKPSSYSIDKSQILSTIRPNNEHNSQFWKKDSQHSIKDPVQDGLYGSVPSSGMNIPSYQKDMLIDLSTLSTNDNYNRYSDVTPVYQKILSSTQNSWTDVSSYLKEGNTQSSYSKDLFYDLLLSNQKPTSHPIYQKDDQSKLSLKTSVDKPSVLNSYEHDSYKNPTKLSSLNNQLSSTPYWSETSTINIQVHKPKENFNPKPTKMQSITLVNETIKTIHQPYSGYVSQHKGNSEIPRPLTQRIKNNITTKAGQYYYEKNVLHRYPDEIIDQIPKNNHNLTDKSKETLIQDRKTASEKIAVEASIIDNPITNSKVIENDENKLTTTPTLVIIDHDNHKDDVVDDLQRTFSTDIENIAPADVLDRYFL